MGSTSQKEESRQECHEGREIKSLGDICRKQMVRAMLCFRSKSFRGHFEQRTSLFNSEAISSRIPGCCDRIMAPFQPAKYKVIYNCAKT